MLKRKKHSDEQLDVDKIKKACEQPEIQAEEISQEQPEKSSLDSALTSDYGTAFTSGHERVLTSSRFDTTIGRKRTRIKKEGQQKIPWPGEETILVRDNRKRNVRLR